MVTWAAAQESRRWCFHKRSNFETRPQPGWGVGNNKFVLGSAGETKTMTQARRKITAGLEENVLDDTWKRMAPGQAT